MTKKFLRGTSEGETGYPAAGRPWWCCPMNGFKGLRIGSWRAVAAMILGGLLPLGAQEPDSRLVRHRGFADFSQGTFGASGRNAYVSAKGDVQMIHRWDLNRDGQLDLVFTQDTNYRTETPDALIYWGAPEGFVSLFPPGWEERPRFSLLANVLKNQRQFLRLPAFGGGRSRVADLNRDGYPDIIFVNLIHNYTHLLSAYVYWGGPEGYSVQRRTELPTLFAHGVDVGDLNGDGYPDLVFANRGDFELEERFGPRDNLESYIYWGGPLGFGVERRTSIPTHNALDCAIGDFNGDGSPDLAFINAPRKEKTTLAVYYGEKGEFAPSRRAALAVDHATSLRALELNQDKRSELVVSRQDDHSLVLWGSPDGLRLENALSLPTADAQDAAAGDFNRDGFVDLVFANQRGGASVIYWGSAQGLSAARVTALPTLAARAVAAADFNADGFPDLVFANSQDEKGHDVPTYIYWGSEKGFAPYLRAEIQGFGPVSVAAGDFNHDGRADILLVNQLSGLLPNHVNGLIFWGNAHHFYSAASMTVLRDIGDGQVSNADLNDDGYPDLVFMNTICWGSASGYRDSSRTVLPAKGTLQGSRVADFNRDGFLDLLFSHRAADGHCTGIIYWGGKAGYGPDRAQEFSLPGYVIYPTLADLDRDGYLDMVCADVQGQSSIVWGSPEGFGSRKPTFLKTDSSNAAQVADLNGDGWLDLIYCGSANLKKSTKQAESYVYFGGPGGFLATPPVRLEGYTSLEVAVGDLNHDGHLDLVFGNYSAGLNRTLPVFIYWGGPDGTFHNGRRTALPAESSAGIQLLDLDGNGYLDIVVHNHIKEGKHDFGAYIYWGGSEGYSIERRSHLPTTATHMSTMMDVGNVYDRRLEEEYLSPPVQAPSGTGVARLHWKAETPFGTALKFQVRTADQAAELSAQPWQGPSGSNSYFSATAAALPPALRGKGWLQYRTVLTTPDGGSTPILQEVAIECAKAH